MFVKPATLIRVLEARKAGVVAIPANADQTQAMLLLSRECLRFAEGTLGDLGPSPAWHAMHAVLLSFPKDERIVVALGVARDIATELFEDYFKEEVAVA
jgi:hypothetical protein